MAALMGVASSISRFASYFLLRRTAACCRRHESWWEGHGGNAGDQTVLTKLVLPRDPILGLQPYRLIETGL